MAQASKSNVFTEKKETSVRQFTIIIVFVLLVVALPFLVIAVRIATSPESRANPALVPKEVIVSNLTANDAVVSFTTQEPAITLMSGSSSTGEFANAIEKQNEKAGSQEERRLHYFQFSNLTPNTDYTFTISSGNISYDEPEYTFTTLPTSETAPTPSSSVFGSIEGSFTEGVVYTMIGNESGNSLVSSTLIEDPSQPRFAITLSNFKDENNDTVSPDGRDILIYVNGLDGGKVKDQFPAEGGNIGSLPLDDTEVISFSPTEKITPGADPVNDTSDGNDDDEPVDEPDSNPDDYFLDDFSESLLESPQSGNYINIFPDQPQNILISNLTAVGFTVNWSTLYPTTGFLEIIEGGSTSEVPDPRDGGSPGSIKRFTHSVDAISDGSIPAGTTVEFLINVNDISFGSNLDDYAIDFAQQLELYTLMYYPESFDKLVQNVDTDLRIKDAEGNPLSIPEDPATDPIEFSTELGDISGSINADGELIDLTGENQELLNLLTLAEDSPVNTQSNNTNEILSSNIPEFEYNQSPAITPENFKVIIPAAPDNPPLPISLQIGATSTPDIEGFLNLNSELSSRNLGFGSLTENNFSRDTVIMAKTINGLWTSEIITESGGVNLSIGSSLTTLKDEYVSVDDGDSVDVFSFGSLGQQVDTAVTYNESAATPKIELTGGNAVLGSPYTTTKTDTPIIAGFIGGDNSTATISVNGQTQQISVADNGIFQINDEELIEQGINIIEFSDGNGNTVQRQFFIDIPELPVTSINLSELTQDQLLLLLGFIIILLGIIIYFKYGRKNAKN